jgi:hypothetical protein
MMAENTDRYPITIVSLIGGVARFLRRYSGQKRAERGYSPLRALRAAFNVPDANSDILIMGDSVMERIAKGDTDCRPLKKMIPDFLEKTRIRAVVVSFSAYTIEMYYLFFLVLKCCSHRPRVIVMPINLRSFSPQWDPNPTYQSYSQIREIAAFLTAQGKVGLGESSLVVKKNILAYLFRRVNYPGLPFTRIYQFIGRIFSKQKSSADDTLRRKLIFVYHYLFTISSSHRKIEYLHRAIDEAASLGIRVFFYIVPINYQGGITSLGERFAESIRGDIEIVKNAIAATGSKNSFNDYSQLLTVEKFFSPFEAAEHLNQSGRLTLAEKLSEDIAAFYRDVTTPPPA